MTRHLGEGSEPGRVRFAVWDESGATRAAVSLEEIEAVRLAAFLGDARLSRRSFLEQQRSNRHV